MGGVWFQFNGGLNKGWPSSWGPKQRMIKYRLCLRYDWTQKPKYSNIETFSCMGGLTPHAWKRFRNVSIAPKKIITGGLSPPPTPWWIPPIVVYVSVSIPQQGFPCGQPIGQQLFGHMSYGNYANSYAQTPNGHYMQPCVPTNGYGTYQWFVSSFIWYFIIYKFDHF